MMEHNEMKTRICELVNITEDKFQLARIISSLADILKKDLSGLTVKYHCGGGYVSSSVSVEYPASMIGFKLPDLFYVRNVDGVRFKVHREATTFGGGHGEGSPQPGMTTRIECLDGYNWDYKGMLTIITEKEALV